MMGKDTRFPAWLRPALFAAALLLILMGVFNGSMADVLAKAAAVCTECIGLG